MRPRRPRPRRDDDPPDPRAGSSRGDTRRRLRARRLPAHDGRRRRRSTSCSASSAATSTSSSTSRSPTVSVLIERMLGRAQPRRTAPTTRPRRCERRLELYARETAPLIELLPDAPGERRRRRTPTAASTRSSPRSQPLARVARGPGVDGRRVIIRKIRSRDRGDGPRGRASSPRRLPSSASTSSRASRCASSTAIADEHIAANGATPTSKGYKGFPAALCISPNAMVVHGIPNDYRRARGRPDLARPRRHARRPRRRQRDHAPASGRSHAEAQRLLDVCQEALVAGIEQARPANQLSDISHAVQVGRRGRRLLGRSQPRRPRRRPLLPRGAADPELRPARPRAGAAGGNDPRDRADDHRRRAGRLRPRRRLVDLVRRRLARGPLRAHRCRHDRRAPDPHGGESGFATMIALAHGSAVRAFTSRARSSSPLH